jgi:hypothetical protein
MTAWSFWKIAVGWAVSSRRPAAPDLAGLEHDYLKICLVQVAIDIPEAHD